MSNIAIIPARGGSKRIPRKNIKDFLGKPILAYSIETAQKSALFDEVMVSTEDEEIAAIARKYGASVPFMRSAKNADDYTGTMAVIQEVLGCYSDQNVRFNYACCIYPTAPLIDTEHLKKGFDLLTEQQYETTFPVVPFSSPIWRGLEIDEKGTAKMLWPEYMKSRSQDLKPVYHDAGQWYWVDISKISDKLFTDNTGTIVLNDMHVQDIDSLSDWELAELKCRLLLK
jgi:pseudaminic acid cytidylyltransferase